MRRFSQVVLHAGTERTGSTSVQRVLFQFRAELARQGVLVPQSLLRQPERSEGVANHVLLPMAFADEARFPHDLRTPDVGEPGMGLKQIQAWIARRFADELEAADPALSTLLLSAEHIHSRLDTTSSLERLRDFLAPHVGTVRIVVFLRPQVEMAVSAGNLQLLQGRQTLRLIPQFDGPSGWDHVQGVNLSYFDLHAMVDRFAQVFGPEAVRPHVYESRPGFRSQDVLLRELGVDLPDSGPQPRLNASLRRDAQEALLFVNRHAEQIPAADRQRLMERINWLLTTHFSGKGVRPSRDEAEAFMALFAAGNEAIRAAYFPWRERLFDIAPDAYPEQPEALADLPDAAAVLFRLLIELAGKPG